MTTGIALLDTRLNAMTAHVRSFDSVLVVGSGMSAFAYPMTGQLPALVWQAVSDVDGAPEELARRAGTVGTPKEILGTDPSMVVLGWELIRDLPQVRAAFQQAFVALDGDREPSSGHIGIARLIHANRVRMVVSYNWDSCLERAYLQEFGAPLPPDILYKPHGDVLRPDGLWTLPDEDGLVPPEVLTRVIEIGIYPRTLIVLGYSGSDSYVAENLLAPLTAKWPVYQVGPSADGANGVPTTADEAIGILAERLLPPSSASGWRHVVFEEGHRRDFAVALRGERLRPVDVFACPELPYAKSLAERLSAAQFATLSGGSGTGKSITAFHAARRLNTTGWMVVELARTGVATSDDIKDFLAMPGPVLAVVDDAQALDPAVCASFMSASDREHAVLLVSTERLEGHNDERVAEVRAKEQIYQHCVANIDEIEPILTAMDDRVGNGMVRESARHRLDAANASARDPWSFMFVASGGERRISTIIDHLSDDTNQTLMLAAIAAGQIVSQDAGLSRDEAALAIAHVEPGAFGAPGAVLNTTAFENALQAVQAERIVRENRGQLRTAHIRVADRALLELARSNDDAIGAPTRALVRNHLRRDDLPIRGKYWLLQMLSRSDSLRHTYRQEWLDDDTVDVLIRQVSVAAGGADRSVAGRLVADLNLARVLQRSHWEQVTTALITWLPKLTPEEIYGVREVIGALRQDNKDLHQALRDSVTATAVAKIFSSRGTRPTAPAWSKLLNELSPPDDSEEHTAWATEFAAAIDVGSLQTWLGHIDENAHPGEIYDLIDTLAALSPPTASIAFQACANHIRDSLETDLADAISGFSDWVFGYMHAVARLAPATGTMFDDAEDRRAVEEWGPSKDLQEFAQTVLTAMKQVDWKQAGASLTGRSRYQLDSLDMFLAWLGWLSEELLGALAAAISFEWLAHLSSAAYDQPLSGADPAGQGEIAHVGSIDSISDLLDCLAASNAGRVRVREYLEDCLGRVDTYPFRLISTFPDLAVTFHGTGAVVLLPSPRGGSWENTVEAATELVNVDPEVARQVLTSSAENLREALQSPQAHDMRGLPDFIEIADTLDPAVLDGLIRSFDVQICHTIWAARLVDAGVDAKALVGRAAKLEGSVGAVARGLLSDADS